MLKHKSKRNRCDKPGCKITNFVMLALLADSASSCVNYYQFPCLSFSCLQRTALGSRLSHDSFIAIHRSGIGSLEVCVCKGEDACALKGSMHDKARKALRDSALPRQRRVPGSPRIWSRVRGVDRALPERAPTGACVLPQSRRRNQLGNALQGL